MAVLKLILSVCGQIRKHSERFFHLSLSLVDSKSLQNRNDWQDKSCLIFLTVCLCIPTLALSTASPQLA